MTQVGYHNRFVGASARSSACSTRRHRRRHAISWPRPTGPSCSSPRADLAQPHRGGGASTTMRRTPSTCSLVPRRADRRRRRGARQGLLGRDRRRGSAPSASERQRAALRQLVGRVLTQDDHADHHLGHRRADPRRPSGVPGVPARTPPVAEGYRRLEREVHDRADRPVGFYLRARSTAPSWTTSSAGSRRRRVGDDAFTSAASPTGLIREPDRRIDRARTVRRRLIKARSQPLPREGEPGAAPGAS